MGIAVNDWTSRITGSAFSDHTNNKITAPHGKYIIAMQAVGTSGSTDNALVKVVAADSSMHWNTEAAAHIGTANDVANDGTSTVAAGTAITMTTSYVTKGYAVGWYVDGVGVPYGTKVTEVNVGGDPLEIKLDNAFVCTDQTIYFTNPNDKDHGTGGVDATTNSPNISVVVGGGYIYGKWLSVQPETDADGGIICYFGE